MRAPSSGGFIAVALAGAAVLAAGTSPAAATSCAGNPPSVTERLDDGPVFVGTVVSTRNDGTWGTFAVEEVWSGDVADGVEVKAGVQHDLGDGKFQGMSGEQQFAAGRQYLVTAEIAGDPATAPPGPPSFGDPGDVVMGICTPLLEWTDDLAAYRPESARVVPRDEPIETVGDLPGPFAEDSPEPFPWPWVAGGGIFVVIVGVGGVLAWRAGRRADEAIDDAEIEELIDHDRHRAGLD